MVDAIGHDRRRILPCVAILDGEYDQRDIAMGVPAVLDKNGLVEIVELKLDAAERDMFEQSANMVRRDIDNLT